MYNGDEMAAVLTNYGLPCVFCEAATAPRFTTYFFKIQAGGITPQKIKNAVFNFSLFCGFEFEIVKNSGYNLALRCAEENYTVNIQNCERLKSGQFFAGIGEDGQAVICDLRQCVHCLVAGTTGSGKTVFIKSMLYKLLSASNSKLFKIAIIDKKGDLNIFGKAAHCMGVANDSANAARILRQVEREMDKRYSRMRLLGYSSAVGLFPCWVLVVDELADLLSGTDRAQLLGILIRLAQLGRAADIHLIIGTQTPRAAILNGCLLANLPTKFIFRTVSARESVICLGHKGAEMLTGAGDMIAQLPDSTTEKRIQAPYISDEQLKNALS